MRAAAAVLVLALCGRALADGAALVEQLGQAVDREQTLAAVTAIEAAAPTTDDLDGALAAAARACEDVLGDPQRALALYERLLHDHPHSSATRLARERAPLLRASLGTSADDRKHASALAAIQRDIDRLPHDTIEQRLTTLIDAAWAGAPAAALFRGEWRQRIGDYAAALSAFAVVSDRWPRSPEAAIARRGAAATALTTRDWTLAERLTLALPAELDLDRTLRDELLERIARGRTFARWYIVAWIALAAALCALLASLLEAMWRGGRQSPRWRPPLEVLYLLPIAVILVAVAATTHQAIGPAVVVLVSGGLIMAYLSGITLELARTRSRATALRTALHITCCVIAALALLYIVLMHDELLEMMIETLRFGPE